MSDQATPGDSVMQSLVQAFTEADAPIETAAAEEPVEIAPEEVKTDEPEKDEPKVEEPKEESKEEETPEEATASEEVVADEPKSESGKPISELGYLSADEIKAEFPRNSSKSLIAYAEHLSGQAKAGKEASDQIAAIGGEHFVEPLAKMTAALRDPDPQALAGFFEGTVEAAGVDALVSILNQSMFMGFVRADEWMENPDTAEWGKTVKAVADAAIEQRFGADATKLNSLVQLDKLGWFDKIAEWQQNGFVDEEEFDALNKTTSDPVLTKLALENAELRSQKEKAPAPDKSEGREQDVKFSEDLSSKIETSLATFWEKSPLRDIDGDTSEMKSQKAFLRDTLTKSVEAKLNTSADRNKLLQAFKSGKQNTAAFKTDTANAILDAIKAISPESMKAEQMLQQLYGNKRNAKLPTPPTPEPLKPTEPTKFEQSAGPKTVAQVDKDLEAAFAALG